MKKAKSPLSEDMRILIAVSGGRPIPDKELETTLDISAYLRREWTKRLAEAGFIEEVQGGWILSDSELLTTGLRESLVRANIRLKVNTALAEFSAEKYEGIAIQDVSNRTGLSPKVIEDHVYILAPDHDLIVTKESSWKNELAEGEHILDVIVADAYKKELSKVDPKSKKK